MLVPIEVVSVFANRHRRPSQNISSQQDRRTVSVQLSRFARHGQGPFLIHECGYLPNGVRWHFPEVRSPYWRLYYNHEAGSFVRSAGRVVPLVPEHVVLIPEDVLFDCVGEEGTPHMWLHFAPVGTAAPPLRGVHVVRLRPAMRAAITELVAVHRSAPSERKLQRIYHAAAALLHASFGHIEESLLQSHPEKLENILAFIDGALSSPLSVPLLARRAGMSLAHFARWFKQHTGTTPADYIVRSRVRRVRRLLGAE